MLDFVGKRLVIQVREPASWLAGWQLASMRNHS